MSNTNSLSVLTERLSPVGQQRLFEFLDFIDTDSAARFRSWLTTATDTEVGAAVEIFNRASQGREIAGWWRSRDRVPANAIEQSAADARTRTPFEHLHSQAYARSANRDLTVGGLWLLGGLLVTIGSYSLAASSPNGGHFVIATGAMLYGAIRLFRGFKAG